MKVYAVLFSYQESVNILGIFTNKKRVKKEIMDNIEKMKKENWGEFGNERKKHWSEEMWLSNFHIVPIEINKTTDICIYDV
jgi:hypothetical protein